MAVLRSWHWTSGLPFEIDPRRSGIVLFTKTNTRLSRALCKIVGDVIQSTGGHSTLDALFITSGASGEPPARSHAGKWKEWLFRSGQDARVDSLQVLGNVLEEYMDTVPASPDDLAWKENKARIEAAFAEDGLRYYRHGRVLPVGRVADSEDISQVSARLVPAKPDNVDEVVQIVIQGLRRGHAPAHISAKRSCRRPAGKSLIHLRGRAQPMK